MIQWILLILGISNFWSNSLGIRFWKFCWIFRNAWAGPICVGVTISESPNMSILLRWSFSYMEIGVFVWFRFNPRNFNLRNFRFLVSFSFETIFPLSPSATTLVSKDVKFPGASFGLYKKFARWCPPTKPPTQKFKIGFWILNSQGISSSLVSFGMIFEALQSDRFRFKFHSLGSKILKIPEFNLDIFINYNKSAIKKHE